MSKPPARSLVLVCKACQRRGSGPKDLKAKAVAHAIVHAMRAASPRPRSLLTSCQGLCPKRAIAVTTASDAQGLRVQACASRAEAADLGAALLLSSLPAA